MLKVVASVNKDLDNFFVGWGNGETSDWNTGGECSPLDKNRGAWGQDFFQNIKGEHGAQMNKGNKKNDFTSRRGKTYYLACERERETGKGYRLRYSQQTHMTPDNPM
jgi:hypothetical protein